MGEENHLKFLGTAGARHVVARQIRYSAGTYLRAGGRDIMIDPGPGTLVRCALVVCTPKYDPGAMREPR